jgi:hypothetical protein
MCEQLGNEPALADAGNADERHVLRRSFLAGALERTDELIQLSAAADQRRAGRDGVATDSRARRQRLPDADRFGLPLRLDGLGVAIVDQVPGRPVGRLADEDPVHRRGRLQPRGGVHPVTRRHPLTLGGPGAEERHHCVADELLHRATEAFELHTEACVVRGEERAHVLRVELLGAT